MFEQTISFDDVLLVPQVSDIVSRREVDISSKIKDNVFRLPVISSPMDTVTEEQMTMAMDAAGGLGIIHRYNSIGQQAALVNLALVGGCSNIGAAVGVSGDFLERAQELVRLGANIVCIDVAHGHHLNVKKAIEKLKNDLGSSVSLMAGNVATAEAFSDLEEWGADIIRVGVGGGSICSTRIQTGHGLPTFHSLVLSASVSKRALIVADGGIKTAGDAVKCFAAGADFVMLGSLLAGSDETPGQVLQTNEGKKCKVYRGMASVEAQVDWKGEANSLEGISTTIPYKGPVEEILSSLGQNIRSGFSYSGARSLKEMRTKAKMVLQTQSGQRESFTHILSP